MAYRIAAYLPDNRWLPGFLTLFAPDGRKLLYDLPCRGKADSRNAASHGNADRDPRYPWGDLPAGRYAEVKVLHYDPRHATFGDSAILLEGESGDALTAKANGRTGLAIHAGRGNDQLMATYGCLRVFDRDMAMIADAIGDDTVTVEVISSSTWPPRNQPMVTPTGDGS